VPVRYAFLESNVAIALWNASKRAGSLSLSIWFQWFLRVLHRAAGNERSSSMFAADFFLPRNRVVRGSRSSRDLDFVRVNTCDSAERRDELRRFIFFRPRPAIFCSSPWTVSVRRKETRKQEFRRETNGRHLLET